MIPRPERSASMLYIYEGLSKGLPNDGIVWHLCQTTAIMYLCGATLWTLRGSTMSFTECTPADLAGPIRASVCMHHALCCICSHTCESAARNTVKIHVEVVRKRGAKPPPTAPFRFCCKGSLRMIYARPFYQTSRQACPPPTAVPKGKPASLSSPSCRCRPAHRATCQPT